MLEKFKMGQTKLDQADLDSPCQELSSGGLVIVVTLLVRWQIIFLSARIGRPIQLYLVSRIILQSFIEWLWRYLPHFYRDSSSHEFSL